MMLRRILRSSIKTKRAFFGGREKWEAKKKETGLFDEFSLQNPENIRKLPENPGNSEKRTSLQIVDDLSNELCKAADLAECVRQLHSSRDFRDAAEDASREFCEIVESLNTNIDLYKKLKASEITENDKLDDVSKRTLDLLLDDFEQSGVHLEQRKREEFVELSSAIFDSGARFQANCDRFVNVKKPDQAKFGLPSQLYTPISNSLDRNKRKVVYDTFYKHDQEQETNLRNLISSRHNLAKLTGFESFSHRAQRNSLLENYENARDFLWGVVENCRDSYERELAVLVDVGAQCHSHESEAENRKNRSIVAEHDLSFLMHLYRERAFDIAKRTRESAPFFTISSIFAGFSTLTERLYGVKLVEKSIKDGEMWKAQSVFKLAAIDSQNNELGTIYVDTSIRPEKAVGDCHYTVRCSKLLRNQQWQYPILVLSLGLQDEYQKEWKNVNVRPHSAETIFHELGHAMHSILGRTRYQHVAGTRCPQDFSEIPSNLMEYFFNDLNVMRDIIRNPEEPNSKLSIDSAATILASRHSFTAIETVQQAAYGLYDLEVHESFIQQRFRST
ncbi:unnamed protein product [Caenorhabditis angaria]|uniref:Peptidase M3A/M3B catalytic domain-containing protein n=1 Tax=Caenorhabditis angaria TaxID=860376 RepID=A0A9P1IPP0_9PELO|nr:unnamed protein product [Caenorhabditis angaria]